MKENFKSIADKLISQARAMFLRDGFLAPIAFTIDDADQVGHKPIQLTSEADYDRLPEFLRELSLSAEAVIILADSILKKRNSETGEETQGESLMGIIHTKDSSHVRYLTYMKREDSNPIFFDMGWTDVLEGEWENISMSNPFRRI
jgi:hypothetical protein